MNVSWLLVGICLFIFFSLLPFLNKKYRTKENIQKTILSITLFTLVIITALIFQIDILIAVIIFIVLYILLDKKTYTKKRLLIYGAVLLLIVVTVSILFRDNPDYVLHHLQKNPETTSLYVKRNGEEIISYQADTVRPLASTMKIPIAVEYAMQVEEGLLDKEELVPLDELARFYFKDTDGGAHEQWLEAIQDDGKVTDGQVALHEVAKGMIMFSSNANTEYLMHKLGIPAINNRIEKLGFADADHDPVYPIVGALLIPEDIATDSMDKNDIVAVLEAMSMENYRERSLDLSLQLEKGEIDIESYSINSPFTVQRVWSDRLPGGTARTYGELLGIISNDELPGEAAEIVRDLLEWPMEINKENENFYAHIGAKGGSTAFILNDALYAEDLDGNKTEIVILTDDLNIWESLMLGRNLNSFQVNIIMNEDYLEKVKQELQSDK